MRANLAMLASLSIAACASAQNNRPWLLPNFSDRIEATVTNSGNTSIHKLIVLHVKDVASIAPAFPGSFALAMDSSGAGRFIPIQFDDFDQDHKPDDVSIEVDLAPHATKNIAIYYSNTLHDVVPYTKAVHASHAYGYNRSTVAIESEKIGYRMYGGFFFDVQAHRNGEAGLFNTLLGYTQTNSPTSEGRDIVHYGRTLGLGGIFLRSSDGRIFQPPFNTPNYTHKPAQENEPTYRVISDGPLRAIVEATASDWHVENDVVSLRAIYEMRADEEIVRAHIWITSKHLTRSYEVGVGVLNLLAMQLRKTKHSIAVSGTQTPAIGQLSLGIAFDPATASMIAPVHTADGDNQAVRFHATLAEKSPVEITYTLGAAWQGSGIEDPLLHLQNSLNNSFAEIKLTGLSHSSNPHPDHLEGEPN